MVCAVSKAVCPAVCTVVTAASSACRQTSAWHLKCELSFRLRIVLLWCPDVAHWCGQTEFWWLLTWRYRERRQAPCVQRHWRSCGTVYRTCIGRRRYGQAQLRNPAAGLLAVGAWDRRAEERCWRSHVQAIRGRLSHDGQCEEAVKEAQGNLSTACRCREVKGVLRVKAQGSRECRCCECE